MNLYLLEERFLEDSELICDVLAIWENDINDSKKKGESFNIKIFLKIQLYYLYNENDIDTVTMIYYQVKFNLLFIFHL